MAAGCTDTEFHALLERRRPLHRKLYTYLPARDQPEESKSRYHSRFHTRLRFVELFARDTIARRSRSALPTPLKTGYHGRDPEPFEMSSSLERLPSDVLQHIAFLIAASDVFNPGHNLFPLLITCSSIYHSLSPATAPHLYARIFRVKFDTEALFRRVGILTDTLLAKELERRCRFLARARRFRGPKPPPQFILRSEDFRVALHMILQNDGMNEAHLESAELKATVLDFLTQVLRHETGVERKESRSGCVQEDGVAIALWVLLLSWRRGMFAFCLSFVILNPGIHGIADICLLSEEMRQQLLILLRPLVHSSLNVSSLPSFH